MTTTMDSRERRTALIIGVLYFVRMLGLFILLPVMAIGAGALAGTSPLLVGVALGVYGLTQAFLQIPLGLLSDRIGRKPVLIGALLVFVTGSVLAAVADHIYLVLIGRALQGCGAIAGTLLALMSDLTRVEQRAKAMAMVGGFISLAFGLAMVLAPLIYAAGGLSAVFWVTAAAGVGALALVLALPTPTLASRNLDAVADRERLTAVVRRREFLSLYFGIFCLHALLMLLFVGLPAQLVATGAAALTQSGFYFGVLLVSLALIVPLVFQTHRFDRVLVIYRGAIFALVVGCIGLSQWSGFWALVMLLIVFFAGFNLLEVVLPALLSRVAPAGMRGTVMGVYATCQFIGIFCGGAAGGWLAARYDFAALAYAAAGIAATWLLVTLAMPKLRNQRSETVDLSALTGVAANQIKEQLLSLGGVIEVVLLDREQVAYLKVDSDQFDEENLRGVLENLSAPAT